MVTTLGMVALALLAALLAVVVAQRARRPAEPLPPVLLGLELARMAKHVRLVEESDQPWKAERLAATTLAYDLVLRDYCRSVDLPVPEGRGSLSRSQRFEMESALITHGHDW
ncbi:MULTISPECIES: hypothetical protein [unclassified Knoellia]|uniref:hypothetical protein n=1 Tax=Knoellia altitudinis TaxID=3404795 RepID=UPI00360D3B04